MLVYVVVRRYNGVCGVFDSRRAAEDYIKGEVFSHDEIGGKHSTFCVEVYDTDDPTEELEVEPTTYNPH